MANNSNNSKQTHDRAEASFKKEQRAQDGAKAMAEYEAAGVAAREKTARLKALRLAKEAAEQGPKRPRKSRRFDPRIRREGKGASQEFCACHVKDRSAHSAS